MKLRNRGAFSFQLSAISLLMVFFALAIYPASAYARDPEKIEPYDKRAMIKQDHINAGKIYFVAKMYDKALEQWEKALEIDPQDRKVMSLVEAAQKRLGAEAKPVITREERARLKKEEAQRRAEARREAAEKRKAKPETKEEARPPEEAAKPAAEEKPAVQPEAAKEAVPPPEKPGLEEEAAREEAERIVTPAVGEAKGEEPIVVNGDQVEYLQDKKLVIGTGNISITYKDIRMTCNKITVHLDSKDAIAEGNVKITQKGATFTGEQIIYNFGTRVGNVTNGDVKAKPFYGKASRIEKLSETEIRIDNGYATTCDRPYPHYRVQAKQVRIYMNDKVIAKNVFLYVGKVPIFYFPYYIQPLNQTSAHATVLGGRDSDWGYYVLSAFRYYFNDLINGKLRLDYRSKKGLAYGVDNNYKLKGAGQGVVKLYGIDENDMLAFDKTGDQEFKYRVQVRHKWDVNKDTTMMAEFNKIRDQNFLKDYFEKEYDENTVPDNYLSFTTAKRDYTTTFLMRKRMDKYFTVVERLPEYDININNYKVGNTKFYVKSQTSAVYLNEKFSSIDNPGQKDINTARVDSYNQLSYATRLFNFWNTSPYVGMRQTYYSRNKWGDTNLVRGIFNAGIDNYMRFFKTYDVQSNAYGLDIHQLRHIIMPSANYYFIHQPTISPDNLNQFDEIDAIDTANGVLLSLENKLQTKRYSGGELKSVDLVRFIMSTNYMFRLEKDKFEYKSQKFETVDFQLELSPYPWFYNISKMSIDTKNCTVETASTDLTASGGDKWSLGLGYRYEDVESGVTNFLTTEVTYRINDKWKARVYEQFDIQNCSFYEQEYTIFRDLHCWLAEFTYSIRSENDHTFWFALRLKAFPNIPLGMSRSYSRAQPGASQAGSSN